MPETRFPYLCGGVLYFLLAQTKASRGTARDHRNGIKDDHSDPIMMGDLIYTFTGSFIHVSSFHTHDQDIVAIDPASSSSTEPATASPIFPSESVRSSSTVSKSALRSRIRS